VDVQSRLVGFLGCGIVFAALLGSGAVAGAQTVHRAKKVHLLPGNLSCDGLLSGPDWGPYVVANGIGAGNPCVFVATPPTGHSFAQTVGLPPGAPPVSPLSIPYPTVGGGSLVCEAVNGTQWSRAAAKKNGGNLLPKKMAGLGSAASDRPLVKLNIGTRAEIFLAEEDEQAQTNEAIGWLQVNNAQCEVLVNGDPGFKGLLLVAEARSLMEVLAPELG
jgi:hypothetical protein